MTELSDEAQASLRSSIMQDPFVMDLIQKMGAVVVEGSIKAYDGPDIDPFPEVIHRPQATKTVEPPVEQVKPEQVSTEPARTEQPMVKSPALTVRPNFSSKPIAKPEAKTAVKPTQPVMADLFSEPAPAAQADNFQSSSDDAKPIPSPVRKVFKF